MQFGKQPHDSHVAADVIHFSLSTPVSSLGIKQLSGFNESHAFHSNRKLFSFTIVAM
jgi:hypothetical protein